MKKHLKFNLENEAVNVIDEKDSRFARLNIDICSTEPNSHNIVFKSETLKRASKTLFMMPVLAKFNDRIKDVEGHETDEVGLGGFFNKNEIMVEEKDGITYVKGVAYLWKNYPYVQDVLDCLRKRNGEASVSMEIEVDSSDGENVADGGEIVKDFTFQGVTILGKHVTPAIKSSQLHVLSFSDLKEEYRKDYALSLENRYSDIDFTIPGSIFANIKKGLSLMESHQFGINVNALAMAKSLVKQSKITPAKAKQVFKFLNKHKRDMFVKQEPFNSEYIEWLCYGGKACLTWVEKIIRDMQEADDKYVTMFAIEVGSGKHYPLDLNKKSMVDGEWDDSEVRRLAIEDPDFKEIAPKIFLKLEDGWEEGGVNKLKYPVASVVDGKWRYNKKAVSSALADATKEGDTEVKNKIDKLFVENESIDEAKTLIDRSKETKENEEVVEKAEEDKMAEENKQPEGTEIETETTEKVEDKEIKKESDGEPNAEKEQHAEDEELEPKEEKDVNEEPVKDFRKCLEAFKPLFKEDPKLKEMGEENLLAYAEHLVEMLKELICSSDVYMENVDKLEKFKCDVEEAQKMAEVNKVLEEEIKEDMADSEKEEMRCAAKKFSISNLSVWKNMVKAKAYENSHKIIETKKTQSDVKKFANPWDGAEKKDAASIWDEI